MPSIRAVASTWGEGSALGDSIRSGKPMLARPVMFGYSAKFWNTIAMSRPDGGS
ncbi:hypothetical protein Saa2_07702 [Streptomyces acidiscabies]|nr:hypothetical protein Saa2_07702 [Streptomyces acidiscabies]